MSTYGAALRVVHVNALESYGGAAKAAHRLHLGLRTIGIDSKMLVRDKSSSDDSVVQVNKGLKTLSGLTMHFGYQIDRQPLKIYKGYSANSPWSLNWLTNDIAKQAQALAPHIVHLHWIGQGFVPIQALRRFNQPLIWTLHDSWAFTGGCHIPHDCTNYQTHCGNCPQLGSGRERDLSNWLWHKKEASWRNTKMTIVTPSRWLADCARASSLFANRRIEIIPYGLDLNVYRPIDRLEARRLLGLPTDRKLILFGAVSSTTDTNKGFHLLKPALYSLANQWKDSADVVIFGASSSSDDSDTGLTSHYLGYLHDDLTLALMYSAADVSVVPSLSENLPFTVLESLACGTPAVAFRVGGIPDLIEDRQNGYLANPFDTDDLAHGIEWVLEDSERRTQLGLRARQKVETAFETRNTARQYQTLYTEVLNDKPAGI